MTATVDKSGNLVVTIPLQTPTRSSTGKTLIVAKTSGPTPTAATVQGKNVTVSLQAWIK